MSNNYAYLRQLQRKDRATALRCGERLLAMRRRLAPLRRRKREGSLLLATWNIRDFGSTRFNPGPRLDETYFYIAEFIACFDLVAVQEVNRDLSDLARVMDLLGREWDYIATDATEGRGGNDERMAFVYNTEKVWFRKIAGEVVLPEGQLVVAPAKVMPPAEQAESSAADDAAEVMMRREVPESRQQFARTPFVVAFQSGWFRFNLCTVHIYYGAESGAALQRRIDEIKKLVAFFARRQDREQPRAGDRYGVPENYILLGDFNVVSPEHETMAALKSEGFVVPAAIDGAKVRDEDDHFYDQIATRVQDPRFKVVGGGLVNIYQDVFRDTAADRAIYQPWVDKELPANETGSGAQSLAARYRRWRSWQLSDHQPLWIEIETDFADHYLTELTAAT